MSKEKAAKNAALQFLSGYNCAESVLLALARHQNVESPIVPKIATPFGGGMARTGSICGCVTGALMGIGLRLGRTRSTEDRQKAYSAATDFLNGFEKRFGSLTCRDLIGCDLRTPEGHKRLEKVKESKCAKFVEGAVELVIEREHDHR